MSKKQQQKKKQQNKKTKNKNKNKKNTTNNNKNNKPTFNTDTQSDIDFLHNWRSDAYSELYILKLVSVTLTLIEGPHACEKTILTCFSIHLDGICYGVETFWSDERHMHSISSDQYPRKRTLPKG